MSRPDSEGGDGAIETDADLSAKIQWTNQVNTETTPAAIVSVIVLTNLATS